MIKYILACIIAVGTASYATSAYMPGLENEGSIRRDTYRIGNHSGDVSGYTVPSDGITTLYIDFVQSGTAPGGAISAPFSVTTFPSTLQKLYLTGDAAGLDVLFNGVARNALPTPPDGCEIHFSLSNSPSTDPGWFQARLGMASPFYIEPLSADPIATSIYPNLAITNIFYLGSNITLANTIAALSCPVKRHPSVAVLDVATKARLTASADLEFEAAVLGISIGGAFEFTFDENSAIVDPHTDVARVLANGRHSEAGMTLYVVYQSTVQSDLEMKAYGSGSSSSLTQILPVTKMPKGY